MKSGMSAGSAAAPGARPPVVPSAAFMGNVVISPSAISGTSPFTIEFRDTSGGAPTDGRGTSTTAAVSTQQDPLDHTFRPRSLPLVPGHDGGQQRLRLDRVYMDVLVIGASDRDFTAPARPWSTPSRRSRSPPARRPRATATPGTSATVARRRDQPPPTPTCTRRPASYTVDPEGDLCEPDRRVTMSKPDFITRQAALCTVPVPRRQEVQRCRRRSSAAPGSRAVTARDRGAQRQLLHHAQAQTATLSSPLRQRRRGKDK